MTINTKLIHRKIRYIQEDLQRIAGFEEITLVRYLESMEIQLQVERLLERMIGRLLDINYHLLKDRDISPKDYKESFTLAAREGLVDMQTATLVAPCAGLRNTLAHEYDDIDPEKVFQGMQLALKQFPGYLKEILNNL